MLEVVQFNQIKGLEKLMHRELSEQGEMQRPKGIVKQAQESE